MPASEQLKVIETFELSGRGLVAVVDETLDMGAGRELSATVTRPDGTAIHVAAFQEWLLKRQPAVIEKTAFLLRGLTKQEVPISSLLKVERNR